MSLLIVMKSMAQNILVEPLWLLLLVLLVIVMKKMRQRKDNGLPPSPPKLPLIGNLHQIDTPHHKSLAKLACTFGPVMLLDFGYSPAVIVSTAEAAKEVLQTRDIDFCNRSQISSGAMLSYNYVDFVFTPYSEQWKEMRKMITQEYFSQKRLQSFLPVRVREMECFIESIADLASRDEPVELSEKFHGLTANVICEVAFGTDLTRSKMNNHDVLKLVYELEALLTSSAADYFPYVGWIADRITGWKSRQVCLFKKLDQFYQQLIKEHENQDKTQSDHQEDFIDLMLQVEKESFASGQHWFTRNRIKGIIMVSKVPFKTNPIYLTLCMYLIWWILYYSFQNIFAGAIGPPSGVLTWVMTELVRHTDIIKRVQAEIRTGISKQAKIVSFSEIEKFSYLKMVIKETLRLHPLVPLLIRESRKTSQILNYKIHPKTRVYINTYAIGRDPEIYNQPDKFYPERFLNSQVDIKGQHFELLPFGAGRRMCPAMNLGMSTVEFVIANLLYWFDWKLPDGMKPNDINVEEANGLTVLKKFPLILVPVKHNFNDSNSNLQP